MRDMRDPEALWAWIERLRKAGEPWEYVVYVPCENYSDGGHISNNPAEHHSKTSQKDSERINHDSTAA